MINWFNMPDEGLSNGGLFEVKELEVTENGTYETKGEMYNKVTVNVEGGGGSSDFSTAEVTIINNANNSVDFTVPLALEEGEFDDNSPALCFASNGYVDGGNTFTMKVVLYKGTGAFVLSSVDVSQVTLTGDIVPIFEDGLEYYVTGDCTITIS